MEYLERDIEEALMDDDGLLKQLNINPIGHQVPVEHGFIDILAYDPADQHLIVIELKKELVDESAVGQILRYMADITDLKTWIDENRGDLCEELCNIKGVKGLLMGTSTNDGVLAAIRKLPNLTFRRIIPFLNVRILAEASSGEQACSSKTVQGFLNLEPIEQIKFANHYIGNRKGGADGRIY